jgi:hypothetical protein
MGTPGSGRYTTYVPVKSEKNERLSKLFNKVSPAGDIYNGAESNSKAASEAVATAKSVLTGEGDKDIFGNGVDLSYGAETNTAPDTTEVTWNKAGDPANPYVPDLSSPGPGKTEGVDKDLNPNLKSTDVKPNFDPKNPSVNTTSPSATSSRLGTLSLGENLQGGKSSVE